MVVEDTDEVLYKHRQNKDGTFDSICLRCFRTVASAPNEESLNNIEPNHHCSEPEVRHYSRMRAVDHRYRDSSD